MNSLTPRPAIVSPLGHHDDHVRLGATLQGEPQS
jgi:hypothetical protein